MRSRFLPSMSMMGRSAVSNCRHLVLMNRNWRFLRARSLGLPHKPDSMLLRFVLSETRILRRSRPAVLALTSMPSVRGCSAIERVALLVRHGQRSGVERLAIASGPRVSAARFGERRVAACVHVSKAGMMGIREKPRSLHRLVIDACVERPARGRVD